MMRFPSVALVRKHGAQWLTTLEAYAFPRFGDMPIDQVETGHVRDALAEIWLTKSETARRVRQRIGTVLDYAQGTGWRPHAFGMAAVNRSLPKQPPKIGHFEAMLAGAGVGLRLGKLPAASCSATAFNG